MTIEQIRRGIEYDVMQTASTLKREYDGNPDIYAVADCAAVNFEKFAYVCQDESPEELLEHVRTMAAKITEATQESATGEKYYVVREMIESEIKDRVKTFEKKLLEQTSVPKF